MRILYLYPHSVEKEFRQVAASEAPTDRLYGLIELRELGHEVDVAETRFHGRFGRLAKRLKRYVSLYDLATIRKARDYDVVVAKDDFSIMLTVACRLVGTKLVYLDALFNLPRRAWQRALCRASLQLSAGAAAYSTSQIELWAQQLGLSRERFSRVPYAIDVGFYERPHLASEADPPYVLSVGRDLGRRFDLLVEAMQGLGVGLKIVTLPYLLRGVDTNQPWIEVLENVPYERLFRLYAGARLVVVPLKAGITYPSGVRGLLEALALGKPTVATRTRVLMEYAADGDGVIYVEPDDVGQLRTAIVKIANDSGLRERLGAKGQAIARSQYDMDLFARGFEDVLRKITRKSDGRSFRRESR